MDDPRRPVAGTTAAIGNGGTNGTEERRGGSQLDDGLQGRVGAYAGREGLTVGEAIAALLYLGLEFAERQRTGLKEDIEDPKKIRLSTTPFR